MLTDEEWVKLAQRVTALETMMEQVTANDLPHIVKRLDWIYDRLNRGFRPPWSVAVLIATLSSACVGLLVALMK